MLWAFRAFNKLMQLVVLCVSVIPICVHVCSMATLLIKFGQISSWCDWLIFLFFVVPMSLHLEMVFIVHIFLVKPVDGTLYWWNSAIWLAIPFWTRNMKEIFHLFNNAVVVYFEVRDSKCENMYLQMLWGFGHLAIQMSHVQSREERKGICVF